MDATCPATYPPPAHSAYALPTIGATEPFAYADYQNGVYQLDGADVPIDSFLTEVAGWGTADLTVTPGEGLVNPPNASNAPAAEPGLAARLLASGFTARFDWFAVDDGQVSQFDVYLANVGVDGVDDYTYQWDSAFNHHGGTTDHCFLSLPSGLTSFPQMVAGENRVAFTWDSRGVHFSINGGATVGTDDPLDLSLVNLIGLSLTDGTLRGIGFYPPQADADLPAISTP